MVFIPTVSHLKIFWHFYKQLMPVNILLSVLIGSFRGLTTENGTIDIVEQFLIFFLTFGFAFSYGLFELMKGESYYFYFNKGFSKVRLLLLVIILHLSIFVLFQLIKLLII